jgi:hypothetical protein
MPDLDELAAIHIMGWRKGTYGESCPRHMKESLEHSRQEYGEEYTLSELDYYNIPVWLEDREGDDPYDHYKVFRSDPEYDDAFRPSWDSQQLLDMVEEKFLGSYCLVIHKDENYWVELNDEKTQDFETGRGETLNEAILKACLRAKGVEI